MRGQTECTIVDIRKHVSVDSVKMRAEEGGLCGTHSQILFEHAVVCIEEHDGRARGGEQCSTKHHHQATTHSLPSLFSKQTAWKKGFSPTQLVLSRTVETRSSTLTLHLLQCQHHPPSATVGTLQVSIAQRTTTHSSHRMHPNVQGRWPRSNATSWVLSPAHLRLNVWTLKAVRESRVPPLRQKWCFPLTFG